MVNRATRPQACCGACLFLILALLLPPTLHSQTPSHSTQPGPLGSDALPFLTEVLSRYSRATTFDIEYTEERQLKGDYMHNWSKSLSTAIIGPADQYRFEYHGEFGDALQVSDGKTEWIYSVGLNQYTQQPTPSDGPSKIRTPASMGLQRVHEARSTARSIAGLGRSFTVRRLLRIKIFKLLVRSFLVSW